MELARSVFGLDWNVPDGVTAGRPMADDALSSSGRLDENALAPVFRVGRSDLFARRVGLGVT